MGRSSHRHDGSDDDDGHRHKRHKHDKKDKSKSKHKDRDRDRDRHKEKKHKSKSKSKDPEEKDWDIPHVPQVKDPLGGEDWESQYFQKHTEFKVWLLEERKKQFHKLDKPDAIQYFRKFVKSWNRNELPRKYYNGIHSTEVRSTHAWGIRMTTAEADSLQSTKDTVDVQTHRMTKERQLQLQEREERIAAMAAAPRSSSSPGSKSQGHDDEEDPSDRHRSRRDRKDWNESVVEQMLGAKPTGRDAMLEKKRAGRERNAGGGDSPDHGGSDVYGNDSRSEFQRLKEREQAKRERKASKANTRVAELQAKEQARMEEFKRAHGLI